MFGDLDVTDDLSDPDLCSAFTVLRTARGQDPVTADAIATALPLITAWGSIQPATSRDLNRFPDAEYFKGAYMVRTTFVLTAGDATYAADLVQADGRQFTVASVQNWAYGAGYVEALVQMRDLV